MELRHLEALAAVADELSFTRAADRLRIAQSPLSQRIKALEAELGVRLFERTNRRVALTGAGRSVLAEARATLRSAEATRRAADAARRGESGTLRLAFVASAAFLRLPELLRAAAPSEVELLRLNTADQIDALVADRIDVGLARTPPTDPPGGIAALALGPEPFLAVVGDGHPAASSATLSLSELADEPWIVSGGPSPGRSTLNAHIAELCAAAGFAPRIAHRAPDLPSVLGPVAGGLGVSVVPLGIAQLHVPGVASVALADSARPLPTTLLWHLDRRRPVVERMLGAIADPSSPARPAGRRARPARPGARAPAGRDRTRRT